MWGDFTKPSGGTVILFLSVSNTARRLGQLFCRTEDWFLGVGTILSEEQSPGFPELLGRGRLVAVATAGDASFGSGTKLSMFRYSVSSGLRCR